VANHVLPPKSGAFSASQSIWLDQATGSVIKLNSEADIPQGVASKLLTTHSPEDQAVVHLGLPYIYLHSVVGTPKDLAFLSPHTAQRMIHGRIQDYSAVFLFIHSLM
jgi:hypothetical protein